MSLLDHLRKQVKHMDNVTTATLMQEAEKHDRSAAGKDEGAIAVSQVYNEVLANKSKPKKVVQAVEEHAKPVVKEVKKAVKKAGHNKKKKKK